MTPRRGISLLGIAVLLSALGDFLAVIPLALRLQHDSGSGLVVAGLFIALWTPLAVLAGPRGCSSTASTAAPLARGVSLAQAVVAAGLAFAFGRPGAILALTALLGFGVALPQPAEFALVPAVAGGGDAGQRPTGASSRPATSATPSGRCSAGLSRPAAARGRAAGRRRELPGRRRRGAGAARPRRPAARAGRGPRPGPRRHRLPAARPGPRARLIAVAFVSLLFMTASAAAEVFFATDVLHAGDPATAP